MEQKVIYNGQLLVLTQFWATGEPCLWITDPQQIEMPKMEFVGGYPNEYCIFLKNLTPSTSSSSFSLPVSRSTFFSFFCLFFSDFFYSGSDNFTTTTPSRSLNTESAVGQEVWSFAASAASSYKP